MARLRLAVRRTAVATAIASGLLLPACAVSFDGYQLGRGDASAGAGGSAGSGGTASGGAGGTATGGAGGTATGGAGGAPTGGAGGTAATGGAGGTATGGTGGTATGGTGGTGPSCPTNLSGPSMVYVPAGPKGFCIDSSEITNKQYESFLKSNPGAQAGSCSWNSSFAPSTSGACSPSPYDPSGMPDYPISCVDWCDAVAYCAWAGKRLCGQIGGGANNPDHSGDAASSQWYAACSEQGKRAFPYGNTYQGAYCNGLDYPPSVTTIPVEQANLCVGGYDGIYDMSGNVSEWVNSCTGSNQTAQCLYRGGGYLDIDSGMSSLRCDSAPFAAVTATAPTRGFRCCYDP